MFPVVETAEIKRLKSRLLYDIESLKHQGHTQDDMLDGLYKLGWSKGYWMGMFTTSDQFVKSIDIEPKSQMTWRR